MYRKCEIAHQGIEIHNFMDLRGYMNTLSLFILFGVGKSK